MTPVKSSSDKNPPQIGHPAKPATKQLKFPKKKKGKYCFQYKSVRGKAGPTGIEPATPGLKVDFSIHDFNFKDYRAYLDNKYSKSHSSAQFNNTRK